MSRLALLLLLVTAVPPPTPRPNAPEGAGEAGLVEALAREASRLQTELDLARGKGFYLKLDARRGRLSLLLEGVVLEEHPFDSLETAVPEVLFWRRLPPPDWDLHSYLGGTLEPARERERVEVVAPAPSPAGDVAAVEPSPPPAPPTAEEAYSVPSTYRILFAEGPTLEITAEGGGRNRGLLQRAADGVALRARDLVGALRDRGARRVRIQLRMSAEDAATLYRALPADVGVVVVGLAPR